MEEDFEIKRQTNTNEENIGDEKIHNMKSLLNKLSPVNIETDLCCAFAVTIVILSTILLIVLSVILALSNIFLK
jgi:hypothetical protein